MLSLHGKHWSKFWELWSPARQQLWPWRRSKVKVKAWCHLNGLVTRIMHAKYQCSIFNNSEDMSQVNVLWQTDGRTDEQTEGLTDGRMRINVPTLSQKRETIKLYLASPLSVAFVSFNLLHRVLPKLYVEYQSDGYANNRPFARSNSLWLWPIICEGQNEPVQTSVRLQ